MECITCIPLMPIPLHMSIYIAARDGMDRPSIVQAYKVFVQDIITLPTVAQQVIAQGLFDRETPDISRGPPQDQPE